MNNLSSVQEAIWLTQKIYSDSSLYNVGGYAFIEGSLDEDVLSTSIRDVLKVADSIETAYYSFNGLALNDNVDFVRCDIATIDFTDQAEPDRVCLEWMNEDMRKIFDVHKNLVKIRILKSSDKRHYWFAKVHHLVFDGYSMSFFFRSVSSVYSEYVNKGVAKKVYETGRYSDFIKDDKEYRGSEEFENDRQFWLGRLRNLPGTGAFHSCLRPTSKPTLHSVRHELTIPRGLYDQITAFCNEHNCTAFHYFIAVLFLLNGYYNNEPAVIGLPVFNRRNKRFKNTLGVFVNVLPFSVDLSKEHLFADIIYKIKTELKDCYRHQRFALYGLLEELDKKGSIYNSTFSYQKNSYDAELGDLSTTIKYLHNGQQQEDLVFHLLEYSGSEDLTFTIDHKESLFPESFASNLLDHFLTLLHGPLKRPDLPIWQWDYMSAREKDQLLYDFNDTKKNYPAEKTMAELFEEQVEKNPDCTAVIFGETSFSFRSLNEQANQLSHYLRARYDIHPNDLVGIQLKRSEKIVIAMLAVLKSGGAYIPIDPEFPRERIDYILSDSKCSVLIDEAAWNIFAQTKDRYGNSNPAAVNKPGDLAYVIYTSGSTGQPKGCMLEHRSLINRLEWMWRQFGFDSDDVILQKTNYTFDVSVWELLMPLCWGAKMVMCGNEDVGAPERLLSLIERHGITCMHFVPGMLSAFVAFTSTEKHLSEKLGSLRRVIASGEALLPETVRSWYDMANIPLLNLYGPTEASIDVTYYVTSRQDISIPIGQPIWNTQIYITDRLNRLLPVGVQGEICIGGIGLARGYLNRQDLTDEKFVSNPFREGERMYRTGDQGKWMPDGNIEYAGRNDSQVKIRGYRIESGEVENILQTYPDVEIAVVTARKLSAGENELVAYIVSKEALDIPALREHLNKALPSYMVPGYYVRLEAFPLTASGKIDRKRLPEPEGMLISGGAAYTAPRNLVEQELVFIWQGILGRERIGVKDDFFTLGGHSLKVIRLASHIHKQFNVKLELSVLFTATVLEDQACLIRKAKKEAFEAILPAQVSLHYPLSFSQRRLWVLSQFEGGNAAYNMPAAFVVEGTPDTAALASAFNALIHRHEILRTTFSEDEYGDPRQFIHPPQQTVFGIDDGDLRPEKDTEIQSRVTAYFSKPFDLATGPLLRVALYRVGDDKWILCCVMHHIISDGWSIKILINELSLYYNMYVAGKFLSLASPTIQYKDYAIWQMEQMSRPALQEHREYWLKQFEGEMPVLHLSTDKARPVIRTYGGGLVHTKLHGNLITAIGNYSRQQGGTLFMGLLAALNTLLYRYTGQDDIIVGSPIAGREHADLEGQIGFYVNTLALRTRFNGKNSYHELVETVRQGTLLAYKHQAYPFDILVDDLHLPRDTARSPLFDILLVLQNKEDNISDRVRWRDVITSRYEDANEVTSKFDLSFNFLELVDGWELRIEYNTDVFNESTVQRMAGHFERLLAAVVRQPDISIDRLPYLDVTEKKQLSGSFNDTAAGYPPYKTVMALFEERVAVNPDGIAIVFEEKTLTYKELNEKANRLGDYLRQQRQVKVEDPVGIKLERSEWLIIAILAVLKSGGAYIPIDPEYPEDRVEHMLSDSRCKVVIDEEEISVFRKEEENYQWQNLQPVNKPEDLLYIIYTSGSTGRPKGSMVKNHSFVNLALWYEKLLEIKKEDTILLMAPVSFDLAQKNIFTTLISGARLCLPAKLYGDYNYLAETIYNHQVSVVNAAPSAFYPLLDTAVNDGFKRLSSLKSIVLGGEPIVIKEFIPWVRSGYYNGRLINSYGPTECTDVVSSYTVDNSQWEVLKNIPIGRPVDNTRIYILDTNHELVPVGIAGEIFIAGVCVGRGYLGQPELTEEKFPPDIFMPGELMYRTGDMGKWREDGNIEYLGRTDSQVKIRGYRIELGEIEHALEGHPDIRSSVVVVGGESVGEKELIAYVMGEESLHVSEIRGYLRKRLPDYMVPGHFVKVGFFPLTPSGKIDRRRLPSPEGLGMESGVAYVGPRSRTESLLVLIWQELLGKEGIGVKDDFFVLGGHSLKATRLAGRIYREFDVKLNFNELFSTAILEEQARLIEQGVRTKFREIPVGASGVDHVLSSSQRRLWVLSQFEEGNIAYNMPGVYVLEGSLDSGSLERSFLALIDRHEILRTVFREDDHGEVRQYIRGMGEAGFRISYEDLREAGDGERRLGMLIEEGMLTAFDLSEGPLLRAGLYRVGEERWYLVYVMHHIISDGWSMGVLIRELLMLYNGYSAGVAPELSPLRIQYKDFASWQQGELKSGALREHRDYWLHQLEGDLPVLELPADKPRPSMKTYRGGAIRRRLPAELSDGIKAGSRQEGGTLFMGLLAGIHALLYRYTGQGDMIIGSPIAGREHADLENQIGFYVNTVALRVQVSGTDTYRTLLEKVKQVTMDAYKHQAYPFDELVDELHLRRDMSRNALFDIMVVLQNNERIGIEGQQGLGGLRINVYEELQCLTSKLDLSFIFEESEEGLLVSLEYNKDIYLEDTADRLASHLQRLLELMMDEPSAPIGELDYLSASEKYCVTVEFNNTKADYPADRAITGLFEDQVSRTPGNTAVIFEQTRLTYKELNEQANRLGHYLRKTHAIAADDLVGIQLHRSEWLIIAILGVLKSGGAYVPIDPEYPQERMDYIVSDSKCKVLIDEKELEKFKEERSFHEKENIPFAAAGSDLAYVIYTSGSTGKPKGAMITHASVINLVMSQKSEFGINSEDNVLQFSNVAFDASVEQIFIALTSGAAVTMIPAAMLPDIEKLEDLIDNNKITHIHMVPEVLKMLKVKKYGYLKRVISGGDRCPMALAAQWGKEYLFYNEYGPTETTVTSIELLYKGDHPGTVLPIGRPIANTYVYILKEGQLTPIGVVGELYVGGAGVARGYLHNAELTAEKFVDNPFRPGERLYRTGDHGRWLSDGTIEFAGRSDEQVKIRGHRVEPGEIEHVLGGHPDIRSSVVVVGGESVGEKELIAYVMGEESLHVSEIRGYLRKRLPDYMVPGHFVKVGFFPLTPSGKIDRRRLPSPEGLGMESGVAYVGPRSRTESLLVLIWQELLGKEGIGVKDDFFALGGHSLSATRLAARIHKELDVRLGLKELFSAPVLEEQARLIEQGVRTKFREIPVGASGVDHVLSSSQRRLWVLSQFEEGNIAYNMPGVYVLEGSLDSGSLERSFLALIDRHEILRTVFREDDHGEVRQYIRGMGEAGFRISYEDLREAGDGERRLGMLIEEGMLTAFDLSEGPLLRAGLYRVGEERWYLVYVMHHIISDGWSMGVLIRELLMLYNGYSAGVAPELSPLRIQYKDYAVWQNSLLSSVEMDSHSTYWHSKLPGNASIVTFPIDLHRPLVKTYNGASLDFYIEKEEISAVQSAVRHGMTLYMILTGAIKILLYKYTEQENIIIGMPIAGREHADLENQIGFYVNTLALQDKISGKDSFDQVFKKVQQTILEAYEHQAYPFDRLVDELTIKRDFSTNPLFEVMAVLQNAAVEEPEITADGGKLKICAIKSNRITSRFDINFNMREEREGVYVMIEYNTDLYERESIALMRDKFLQLISMIPTNMDRPIDEIKFGGLSLEETILDKWDMAL